MKNIILLSGSIAAVSRILFSTITPLQLFNVIQLDIVNYQFQNALRTLWIMSSVFFIAAVILLVLKKKFWVIFSAAAILTSQIVIVINWDTMKVGTVANIVILAATILGFAKWHYTRTHSGS